VSSLSPRSFRFDDLRRPLVVVVIVVATTATDWPLGMNGFWVEHPLVAAVVAGVLLILLTSFALDAYLRHRQRVYEVRAVA
jgi:hypothetical protein